MLAHNYPGECALSRRGRKRLGVLLQFSILDALLIIRMRQSTTIKKDLEFTKSFLGPKP